MEDPSTHESIWRDVENDNKMFCSEYFWSFDVSRIVEFEQKNNISFLLVGHDARQFFPIKTVIQNRDPLTF
jgi:hypothetical protein